MPYLVRTKADLFRLMRPESVFHPFRKPPILLDLPGLPAAESAVWQLRLEELRQQCGCTSGAVTLGAFTLACLGYVLYAAFHYTSVLPPAPKDLWRNGALFLFGLILSALLGKLLGLALSAFRFRQICRALQMRLQTLPSFPIYCGPGEPGTTT